MDSQTQNVESVTKSDLLELASWNQPRTQEQIMDFISRREAAIFSTEA